MSKVLKYFAVIGLLLIINEEGEARPQDMQTAALMAAAQIKEVIDNGAAAKDKKELEFMGAKFKNDMEMGFGDAMRNKRSNEDSDSYSTSSSSASSSSQSSSAFSSESEEKYRGKRSPNNTFPEDLKPLQDFLNFGDFSKPIRNSQES